ncbi:MAG: transglycosylase SLT domain-containing protein [Paludibacteraceae bacterium]|nr:transglycosylase SLT domain-containing protein [Paludibacteraceae bacterium]
MSKTRIYTLILLSIFVCTSFQSNAAYKKNYKSRHRSYSHTRTNYQNRNRSYQFRVQDSLMNAPVEKKEIVYNEKDIPLDYIIKLDSALHDYQTNYAIQSEPCLSDSVVSTLLDDSVYIQRLQSIPSIVELTYNSVVRDFISLYTVRRSKLTAMVLGQSSYYFPIFEDALDSEGVPFELKYLPIIESALNPRAYSPAGASGLWQFISSTGRMYGLKINSLVDERRDPIKSSKAAARYLKHLYGIYNDWTLVIAAYNCGPGNVNKAIRRAGGERDYWAIYPFLPKETRGYVPAFIAATYAMNFHNEHNICPKYIDRCHYIDTVNVNEKVHLEQISYVLDIDINELRMLNPQYRTDIIPGNAGPCTLILPTDKISQYEMYKNTILAYEVPGYVKHRPQAEPQKLSAYNKRPVNKNSKVNTINKAVVVKTDSVAADSSAADLQQMASISAPQKTSNVQSKKKTTTNKATVVAANDKDLRYKVKPGDTLYSIAVRNNVSVVNLKKWNSLSSDNLRIGQIIVVKNK